MSGHPRRRQETSYVLFPQEFTRSPRAPQWQTFPFPYALKVMCQHDTTKQIVWIILIWGIHESGKLVICSRFAFSPVLCIIPTNSRQKVDCHLSQGRGSHQGSVWERHRRDLMYRGPCGPVVMNATTLIHKQWTADKCGCDTPITLNRNVLFMSKINHDHRIQNITCLFKVDASMNQWIFAFFLQIIGHFQSSRTIHPRALSLTSQYDANNLYRWRRMSSRIVHCEVREVLTYVSKELTATIIREMKPRRKSGDTSIWSCQYCHLIDRCNSHRLLCVPSTRLIKWTRDMKVMFFSPFFSIFYLRRTEKIPYITNQNVSFHKTGPLQLTKDYLITSNLCTHMFACGKHLTGAFCSENKGKTTWSL